MLVLQLDQGKRVIVSEWRDGRLVPIVTILVVEVRGGNRVRIGVEADSQLKIDREEVFDVRAKQKDFKNDR